MAQILAIIWTTFMFSPALPLLYPIGVANLAMMYFMDKYQVFNYNKLPKNFDETLILKVLRYARLTFPFHLVMGLYLLGRPRLQTHSGQVGSTRSASWFVQCPKPAPTEPIVFWLLPALVSFARLPLQPIGC